MKALPGQAVHRGRPARALVFEAAIDGKQVKGCDFIDVGDDGPIDNFMMMVRPLSGATALAEAMGAQLEWVAAEAATGLG